MDKAFGYAVVVALAAVTCGACGVKRATHRAVVSDLRQSEASLVQARARNAKLDKQVRALTQQLRASEASHLAALSRARAAKDQLVLSQAKARRAMLLVDSLQTAERANVAAARAVAAKRWRAAARTKMIAVVADLEDKLARTRAKLVSTDAQLQRLLIAERARLRRLNRQRDRIKRTLSPPNL